MWSPGLEISVRTYIEPLGVFPRWTVMAWLNDLIPSISSVPVLCTTLLSSIFTIVQYVPSSLAGSFGPAVVEGPEASLEL